LKILLIDNYDSFTYNIVDMLIQLGQKDIAVIKNDKIDIQEAANFDQIIISPGPATPIESGNILSIISALAPSHPILGICLGHQAIAEVFGAQLRNIEKPYHGHITTLQNLKPHSLYKQVSNFQVGLYHSWIVDDNNFPDDLEITSYSKEGYIMSLQHRIYNVHGVQFHPESYMTLEGSTMISNFLNL
jgi:anthranilate synthase component 2